MFTYYKFDRKCNSKVDSRDVYRSDKEKRVAVHVIDIIRVKRPIPVLNNITCFLSASHITQEVVYFIVRLISIISHRMCIRVVLFCVFYNSM